MFGIEGQTAIGRFERCRPAPAAQLDTGQQSEIVRIGGVKADGFLGGCFRVLESVLMAENTAAHVVTKRHARIELDRHVGLAQGFFLVVSVHLAE